VPLFAFPGAEPWSHSAGNVDVDVVVSLSQGVDSVSKVYLHPDNAKSRERFEQLWNTISGGVKTVPVLLR